MILCSMLSICTMQLHTLYLWEQETDIMYYMYSISLEIYVWVMNLRNKC